MQKHTHAQMYTHRTYIGRQNDTHELPYRCTKRPIQMQNACVHAETCTCMLAYMYTHGIYLNIFISTYTTQMWEDKGTQNRQAHKYKLTHARRYKRAYEHINAHTYRNTKAQRHVPPCMNIYTEIHTGKFMHFQVHTSMHQNSYNHSHKTSMQMYTHA